MSETSSSPIPGIQICQDQMKLTVTDIYPVFQKESEQNIREEISGKLCQIFRKYV